MQDDDADEHSLHRCPLGCSQSGELLAARAASADVSGLWAIRIVSEWVDILDFETRLLSTRGGGASGRV
jgi:hypothetical protein